MRQFSSMSIFMIIFSLFFTGRATASINGFVVFAEGSGCDRELKFNSIKNGLVFGPQQTAVKKGPGADIWVTISNDGKWITFGRAVDIFTSGFGNCCHRGRFDQFDIYIARIDGNLPAQSIKVGHGYLPTWGNVADQPTKILYFTNYSDRTNKGPVIQKTIIQPDGSFSEPVEYAIIPVKIPYSLAYARIAPNGRYIVFQYRGMNIWDVKDEIYIHKDRKGVGRYQPCWGPRSKYILSSSNISIIKDDRVENFGNLGLGRYHFNISNDIEYDNGKFWIIGQCTSTGDGNIFDRPRSRVEPMNLCYREVDIDQWNVGADTKVVRGTSVDIHIYSKVSTSVDWKINKTVCNSISFTTKIIASTSGLQLIIRSEELSSGYSAVLYDLQGKQKAFINMLAGAKNVLPLSKLSDGRYILNISNNIISIQKPILISR